MSYKYRITQGSHREGDFEQETYQDIEAAMRALRRELQQDIGGWAEKTIQITLIKNE